MAVWLLFFFFVRVMEMVVIYRGNWYEKTVDRDQSYVYTELIFTGFLSGWVLKISRCSCADFADRSEERKSTE